MAEVLERGDIYFLYRPKVEREPGEVAGEEDVQRTYMVLHPRRARRYRLIVVGRKHLPDVKDGGERVWGFVDRVVRRPEDLRDELERGTYQTKTRGERLRPGVRPAGEGVYAIVGHGEGGGRHTHLAYALELPEAPGEVQEELNIARQASYVVSVKNPDAPAKGGAGLGRERRADFPKKLRERFDGRRFADVDPPSFLDHEGAEIVLVGAREAAEEELGIRLDPRRETEASAEVFGDLKLERSRHRIPPLLRGAWT